MYKQTILFIVSMSLLFPAPRMQAVDPIFTPLLLNITMIFSTYLIHQLMKKGIEVEELKKGINANNNTGQISQSNDSDIIQRKTDCARYREAIREFEETLRQNDDAKKFYTGILAPVGYTRYLLGYDERLKISSAQADKEIRINRDFLKEDYCTEVENK